MARKQIIERMLAGMKNQPEGWFFVATLTV
jgi:hypothetical protein